MKLSILPGSFAVCRLLPDQEVPAWVWENKTMLSLTGVLAALTGPLASGGVSIFAISTFDTDYLLVKERDILQAKIILERNGHIFE